MALLIMDPMYKLQGNIKSKVQTMLFGSYQRFYKPKLVYTSKYCSKAN